MSSKGIKGCLLFVFLLTGIAFAQETEEKPFRRKIRGAIMMANSHSPAVVNGGLQTTIIPTWGFDVDYVFHRRWSVAIQTDVKLQSFEVEDGDLLLERSYPIALATFIHYHLRRHWSFYVGPGYEIESHKNLYMIKMGTEYSFEITPDFEIALILAFEDKQGIYDTWTFGIGFNKKLWEKDN